MRRTAASAVVGVLILLPTVLAAGGSMTALAFEGGGVLHGLYTTKAELLTIRIDAQLRQEPLPAPLVGLAGSGILRIETPERAIDVPVELRAQAVARSVGTRDAEAWELRVMRATGGPMASGDAALTGTRGHLHGPGEISVFVPNGPDAGRYELAFVGLAKLAR